MQDDIWKKSNEKNFEIADAIAFLHESNYFDIHNDYVITQLNFGVDQIKINFSCINAGIDKHSMQMIFDKIVYLESDIIPFAEGRLFVSEMGYKNPGDVDLDWLLGEKTSAPEDHFFFRFDGDHFLRILALSAEIKFNS